MKKRNCCGQSSLFFRSINWESISYQTIRSLHTFLRRMAVMAMLLGFCTAVARANPTIVEVHTASSNVIVAVLQDRTDVLEGETTPDFVDTAAGPGHWQVNGVAPAHVYRYSIPWDNLVTYFIGTNGYYPVITRHRIYLVLGSPLQEGHTNSITHPTYGSTNWTFSATNSFCESIKVNQAGYSKLNTSRFANFGVYMGDGGTTNFNSFPYRVINESSGAVLTNGTSIDKGDDSGTGAQYSGEHIYRLSLSYVPEGGPYYVSVPGVGRSRSFGIGDTYSSNIAYVTLRGMFLHRCGIELAQSNTAFTHAICHTNVFDIRSPKPQDEVYVADTNTAPRMFIQGGYHDAGDVDHTEAHPIISILMLSFFEAFPSRFVDNQYNIPESGNGIPDFLDEIMWGVKMWEYLQVTNTSEGVFVGGVRSGWSTTNYTGYGGEDAANDRRDYGTKNIQEDCTGMCAGIFAQASRLIRPYDPVHANSLSNRAQLAWTYLVNNGNHVHDPRTRFLYSALQLYLLTGNPTYHDVFRTAATNVVLNGGQDANGNHFYTNEAEYYWPGTGDATCSTAHFVSYLLPSAPNPDGALVQNLKNKILQFAENGMAMGGPPEADPYPQGVTSELKFGAGTAQGRYADVWMYGCLFTNDPGTLQRYTNAVCQYADFPLGLNPMNMSYYTGLGVDQPNDPLDCNSYYTKYGLSDGVTSDNHRDINNNPIGNVPGIVVYGPFDDRDMNKYSTPLSGKMSPAWDNLPQQRRYAHGHSLVRNNEFTVGQTMAWNVPMYAFLYTPGGLQPPSNLGLTVVSSSQINLSWTDNSSIEDGFKIERKTGAGGTYTQIGTAAANATTYNDPTLTANTTYYYRVRAYKGTTNSTYSNEAHATTAVPAAPSSLSAVAVSSSQVNLGWTDNADNETGFKIERKTGVGGTYAQIGTAGANNPSYSDLGLDLDTTYYYRVRAYNALGNSAYSNETNATTSSGCDTVYIDDAVPSGATTGVENDSWTWVTINPTPEHGSQAHKSSLYSGEHQHFFYGASSSLQIVSGDTLYAYVYLDPVNPPTSVMLQWYDESGTWEHRAYWGPDFFSGVGGTEGTPSKHQESTTLPGAAGTWIRLDVPASDVALEGHSISGIAFTLYGGQATWDNAGVSSCGGGSDTVWVDDQIPAGGGTGSGDGGDGWNWITSNPTPELGTKAHQSNINAVEHQHFFTGATSPMSIAVGDNLYCWIQVDAANPVQEVMLQWYDESNSWEHRAYWGPNLLNDWGVNGTTSRHQVSSSPPASGTWVQLVVPASAVGLEGHSVNGMAFSLYGGRATWDNAGKSH